MKRLSIIIPVYNAREWVAETLESLVTQTYDDVEIICVDDGSRDDSISIIRQYQEKYENIRLIEQKNAGVCAARNAGIEAASGEYIAFIDADDLAEKEMYERMIAQLEEEKSDIIFCEFVRFFSDGHKQYAVETSFPKLLENPQDIELFLQSTKSRTDGETLYTQDIHGACWRSIYKKEIIDAHHVRFHTDLRFAEDQIFVLEYLEHCQKLSYTDKPYMWYRGWTKEEGYRGFYSNHLVLVGYQQEIVRRNRFYSKKKKRQLIGYLKCSACFMIVVDEF